ncbi:hypothetical protein ES703_107491 [subsurface metagenome]
MDRPVHADSYRRQEDQHRKDPQGYRFSLHEPGIAHNHEACGYLGLGDRDHHDSEKRGNQKLESEKPLRSRRGKQRLIGTLHLPEHGSNPAEVTNTADSDDPDYGQQDRPLQDIAVDNGSETADFAIDKHSDYNRSRPAPGGQCLREYGT